MIEYRKYKGKNKNFFVILLILILVLWSSIAFAEVSKLRATSVRVRSEKNDHEWQEWSDTEKCSVLIVIDFDAERIKIYSNEIQVYDIVKLLRDYTDEAGDDIMKVLAVDEQGTQCHIQLVQWNSQNGLLQLYVQYKDVEWVYNVYEFN